MASDRASNRALSLACACVLGCALSCSGEPARFPLREPIWRDNDHQPFSPTPEEYVSPFAWDGANQLAFRPISRFFAVDPAGPAVDVNAYDEVPDSSWFENRLGRVDRPGAQHVTADDIVHGPCGEQVLDVNMPDGSWIIDQGKPNGANPGFRVNIPGVGKFLLKADPDGEPERATGATAIAARIYHAVGYYAPCDSVVYFDPRILKLKPGLSATDNTGISKKFDEAALAKLLAHASHRGALVRMGASRWLPGKPLGPYRYEGTRDDDPNDVVAHEDRRELRGARVLAAWLNHFDTREQNTMDVFMALEADPDKRLGYVRHYILDLGDCFGSVWAEDEISKRLGKAYYLDLPYVAGDFVSFGAIERPWEHVKRSGGIFNYFGASDFVPEDWRGGYPNPAFTRMTEADGAWMARILARMSDELIAAAVSVGQYDAASSHYLVQTLIARRDVILQRYLRQLSPISDLQVRGERLCGTDLARAAHVVPDEALSFSARLRTTRDQPAAASVHVAMQAGGRFCIDLPHLEKEKAASGQSVYMVLELDNGYSKVPLRAHLYDLGPERGFRVVGIERT